MLDLFEFAVNISRPLWPLEPIEDLPLACCPFCGAWHPVRIVGDWAELFSPALGWLEVCPCCGARANNVITVPGCIVGTLSLPEED